MCLLGIFISGERKSDHTRRRRLMSSLFRTFRVCEITCEARTESGHNSKGASSSRKEGDGIEDEDKEEEDEDEDADDGDCEEEEDEDETEHTVKQEENADESASIEGDEDAINDDVAAEEDESEDGDKDEDKAVVVGPRMSSSINVGILSGRSMAKIVNQ